MMRISFLEKFCSCCLSLTLLLALSSAAAYSACNDEIAEANVAKFHAVHKEAEARLAENLKERYKTAHEAFMKYFEAEKENLEIFRGPFETRRHGVVYIYRDTMNNILKNRTEEIASLLANNNRWLSKDVNPDLMRIFAVVNQRVPYDRGEAFRPSFRVVERAWEKYIEAEKTFYALYYRNNKQAWEKCICVLYEQRIEDLCLEHEGVTSIKSEREE